LIDPTPLNGVGTLRRRPAFRALAALARQLPAGARVEATPPAPAGARLRRFTLADGAELVAAWTTAGALRVTLPFAPAAVFSRDGARLALPAGAEVELTPGVRYFRSAPTD
jgi:hypothetical protein